MKKISIAILSLSLLAACSSNSNEEKKSEAPATQSEPQPEPQPQSEAKTEQNDGTTFKMDENGVSVQNKKGDNKNNVSISKDSASIEISNPK